LGRGPEKLRTSVAEEKTDSGDDLTLPENQAGEVKFTSGGIGVDWEEVRKYIWDRGKRHMLAPEALVNESGWALWAIGGGYLRDCSEDQG